MSAAGEQAMARRVALLEKRLAILQARFEAMDKAAAVMAGASDSEIAYQQGVALSRRREEAAQRRGHLRLVRGEQ